MASPSVSEIAEAEELRAAVGVFVATTRKHDVMPENQVIVLDSLQRHDRQTIAELAHHCGVRHQSMTRTIQSLEANALITLERDAHDRRQVRVSATEAGINAMRTQRIRRGTAIAKTIAVHLTPQEREALRSLPAILRKLTQD